MSGDPNNNYECECAKCGEHFRGNKRASICPKCKLVNQAQELDMGYGHPWHAQSNPAEVTPLKDLRDHIPGATCWCKPFDDEGVLVHNALDGREKLERGETGTN